MLTLGHTCGVGSRIISTSKRASREHVCPPFLCPGCTREDTDTDFLVNVNQYWILIDWVVWWHPSARSCSGVWSGTRPIKLCNQHSLCLKQGWQPRYHNCAIKYWLWDSSGGRWHLSTYPPTLAWLSSIKCWSWESCCRDKYILQFEQIHMAIWTDMFGNLYKYVWIFRQIGQVRTHHPTLAWLSSIKCWSWESCCVDGCCLVTLTSDLDFTRIEI